MDMTGEYRIPAPRQRVWEALNDPEILRQSIPGCEQLDKVSDTELTARVKAKVGPVSATFNGRVTLGDLNPPESYTISGEGSGGVAGFAKGGARVNLTEEAADSTVLRYDAKADVGGKLAQIGSRLVQGTAKKMADDFFGRFSRIVGEGYAAAGAGATAPGAAAAPAVGAAATAAPTTAPTAPDLTPPAAPAQPAPPVRSAPPPASPPPPVAAPPARVEPTLSAEAAAGGTPPFVPDEAIAASSGEAGPAARAQAGVVEPGAARPSQFVTRESGAGVSPPNAPPTPAAAPAGPGFFQRPVVWIVVALIVLVVVYLLLSAGGAPPTTNG